MTSSFTLDAALLAPIESLLADPAVTEILIDAPNRVYADIHGHRTLTPAQFASAEAIHALIAGVLAAAGQPLAPAQTTANVRLPDGTQFVAALPPTAVNGPCCVIQKFAVGTNLTWEALVANHSISAEAHAFLAHTVASGINVLATGNASSGITTVAGLLVDLVPADRRVVVVEERLELHPQHPNLVRLVADQPGGPTFAQLMELAAHMHAHRLAFGELTGPETLKAMHILSRGYGGITFMHAENALEALGRLETFCLMANLGLGLDEIRRMIAAAIKLVTFQANHVLPQSNRKIVDMIEVQGVEDGRYVLQPVFRYDSATATWHRLAQASWEDGRA